MANDRGVCVLKMETILLSPDSTINLHRVYLKRINSIIRFKKHCWIVIFIASDEISSIYVIPEIIFHSLSKYNTEDEL